MNKTTSPPEGCVVPSPHDTLGRADRPTHLAPPVAASLPCRAWRGRGSSRNGRKQSSLQRGIVFGSWHSSLNPVSHSRASRSRTPHGAISDTEDDELLCPLAVVESREGERKLIDSRRTRRRKRSLPARPRCVRRRRMPRHGPSHARPHGEEWTARTEATCLRSTSGRWECRAPLL